MDHPIRPAFSNSFRRRFPFLAGEDTNHLFVMFREIRARNRRGLSRFMASRDLNGRVALAGTALVTYVVGRSTSALDPTGAVERCLQILAAWELLLAVVSPRRRGFPCSVSECALHHRAGWVEVWLTGCGGTTLTEASMLEAAEQLDRQWTMLLLVFCLAMVAGFPLVARGVPWNMALPELGVALGALVLLRRAVVDLFICSMLVQSRRLQLRRLKTPGAPRPSRLLLVVEALLRFYVPGAVALVLAWGAGAFFGRAFSLPQPRLPIVFTAVVVLVATCYLVAAALLRPRANRLAPLLLSDAERTVEISIQRIVEPGAG